MKLEEIKDWVVAAGWRRVALVGREDWCREVASALEMLDVATRVNPQQIGRFIDLVIVLGAGVEVKGTHEGQAVAYVDELDL
jgi:hypothetical protein